MHIPNHELREEMYCSQQMCIPPTLPYLLRQFAKAAIRTQPNDLLKWSTAYFRCLSLNIPPPVKPRLEYPIPKDFCGITPGWLKALLHQMPGVTHVSFKTLWDRWIGACLHHPDLIKILCLGGFDDPMAIPWLRFIGLCAAHLTESLTKSMILICEVLTEEPEGGSAMIDVEVFNDLYQFLARIDASKAQMLKNYYFRDSLLGLWEKRIKEDQGPFEESEEVEEEESTASTPEEETVEQGRVRDEGSIISCPSIEAEEGSEDLRAEIERRMREDGEHEDDKALGSRDTLKSDEIIPGMGTPPRVEPYEEEFAAVKKAKKSDEDGDEDEEDTEAIDMKPPEPQEQLDEAAVEEEAPEEVPETTHEEDLARLRAVQEELAGEDDYDIEKLKADLLLNRGIPVTDSQQKIPDHYKTEAGCKQLTAKEVKDLMAEAPKVVEEPKELSDEAIKEAIEAKVKEGDYEEVYVDAVPGIGAVVPERLIRAVVEHMKSIAKEQHHVVMPRNIRHYECPPLEVIDN